MAASDSSIPDCLRVAHQFMAEDRAWVFCLPVEGNVVTLGSNRRVGEVLRSNMGALATKNCPDRERAAFLLGGCENLRQHFLLHR